MNKRNENEIRVTLTENARKGEYSNFVKIQHSAVDFRFDFSQMIADEGEAIVHTRIFMSPVHAKLFMKAIADNVDKYEKQFGDIQLKMDKGIPITGSVSHETH